MKVKVESWSVVTRGTVRDGRATSLPALEMVDGNGDIMKYRFFESGEEAERWAEENLELLGFLREGGKRQNYADFFTTYMEVGGCPFQGSVITPEELRFQKREEYWGDVRDVPEGGGFSVTRHGIKCLIRAIYNPSAKMRRKVLEASGLV